MTPIDLPALPAFLWSKAEARAIVAYAKAAVLADRAALSTVEPAPIAAQPIAQPAVKNIREGAPYDNSKFEELCRNYGIWGTAQAALCAAFWQSATAQPVQPASPIAAQPARPASFIDHAYATAAVITDRAQLVEPASIDLRFDMTKVLIERATLQEAINALAGLFSRLDGSRGGVAVWSLGGSGAPAEAMKLLRAALSAEPAPDAMISEVDYRALCAAVDALKFMARNQAAYTDLKQVKAARAALWFVCQLREASAVSATSMRNAIKQAVAKDRAALSTVEPAPIAAQPVAMTDEQIQDVFDSVANDDPEVHFRFARAIIAAISTKETP